MYKKKYNMKKTNLKYIKTFENFSINEEEGLFKNLILGGLLSLNAFSSDAKGSIPYSGSDSHSQDSINIRHDRYSKLGDSDKRHYQKDGTDYLFSINIEALLDDLKKVDSSKIESYTVKSLLKELEYEITIFSDIEDIQKHYKRTNNELRKLTILFNQVVDESGDKNIGKYSDYENDIDRLKKDIKYLKLQLKGSDSDQYVYDSIIQARFFIMLVLLFCLSFFLLIRPIFLKDVIVNMDILHHFKR